MGLNLNQITCLYNDGKDCDLHWHWQYDFGNCFQFNVGLNGTNNHIDKKMATIAGIDFGLNIKISNFTNYEISKIGGYPGLGMKVYIHNRTLLPRWYEEGVYAKPGEITMIGVKRTFVTNFPSPYTQCNDLTSYSSFLYDFIIKSNKTYRQKDCIDLCIQQRIINICGCFFTLFDNLKSSTRPCLNITDFACFSREYYNVDTVKCASEYCPLECDSIQYDLTVSSAIYPNLDDFNSLNISSSISYEVWRTQALNINVYYSQLEYTHIQETPAMNIAGLISNLGGSMSLIISLSFFTLLEICELFVLVMQILIKIK